MIRKIVHRGSRVVKHKQGYLNSINCSINSRISLANTMLPSNCKTRSYSHIVMPSPETIKANQEEYLRKKPKTSPLKGIRVLDLSRVLAGPYATQILADLGAEVIKVEPADGDITREWGPPYLKDENGNDTDVSAYYYCINRNKKSISVNLKSDEGKKIVQDLARKSDVLIENFRPGVLKKFDLDYESVIQNLNPDIVYASVSGFGQTGTMKTFPGFDLLTQGMGGLMDITGEPDGHPQKIGFPVTDIVSALYSVIGILSELVRKGKTGSEEAPSPHIDVTLFETALSLLVNIGSSYLTSGDVPSRIGPHHPSIVPYGLYDTKDRPVLVAVGTNKQFKNLVDVLIEKTNSTLPDNFWELYERNRLRVKNAGTLRVWISEQLSHFTSNEILTICNQKNIPCGPVNNIKEAFEELPIKERFLTLKDNTMLNSALHTLKPANFEDTMPPSIGLNTNEVLSSLLNLDEEKIEALRQDGSIC